MKSLLLFFISSLVCLSSNATSLKVEIDVESKIVRKHNINKVFRDDYTILKTKDGNELVLACSEREMSVRIKRHPLMKDILSLSSYSKVSEAKQTVKECQNMLKQLEEGIESGHTIVELGYTTEKKISINTK